MPKNTNRHSLSADEVKARIANSGADFPGLEDTVGRNRSGGPRHLAASPAQPVNHVFHVFHWAHGMAALIIYLDTILNCSRNYFSFDHLYHMITCPDEEESDVAEVSKRAMAQVAEY